MRKIVRRYSTSKFIYIRTSPAVHGDIVVTALTVATDVAVTTAVATATNVVTQRGTAVTHRRFCAYSCVLLKTTCIDRLVKGGNINSEKKDLFQTLAFQPLWPDSAEAPRHGDVTGPTPR